MNKFDYTEALHAIRRIASIIYTQEPMKYQDAWLKEMIELGVYNPEEQGWITEETHE